ncbi:MAG: AAA family ATPase [Candidatus Hadarchaeales archaeon]
MTRVMAFCGKGGVGKTFLASASVRLLVEGGWKKILAVDADPSSGLSQALGVRTGKTVEDLRKEWLSSWRGLSREELALSLDYGVMKIMEEGRGFALLAMGRPEEEGCYCKVNEFLREVLTSVSKGFEVVVIDGEAGVEQINRRVMREVNDLLLVSDSSPKSLRVASIIKEVADRGAVGYERAGLVLNKVVGGEGVELPGGMEVLGLVPQDAEVEELDRKGLTIFHLRRNSPALLGVEGLLKRMGYLPGGGGRE